MKQFTTSITYFLQEGRDNLRDCLRIAFDAARNHNIEKLVIFTAKGEGVRLAIEQFISKEEHRGVAIVGVSFPAGKRFTDGNGNPVIPEIPAEDVELFEQHEVPIVRAHLPFDPIFAKFRERGLMGQDATLVGNALNMFGGSMSLCVQAIAIACDAGVIKEREHVIALTSDTAILAQAAPTPHLLSDLVIREILCKPAVYTIGRKESVSAIQMRLQDAIESGELSKQQALPSGDESSGNSR